MYSLKNKLFQVCFATTFCAMTANIISTVCIYYYTVVPTAFTWFITLLYFAATPLMGMVYFFYAVGILYERQQRIPRSLLLLAVPAAVYLLMVLCDPWTKQLFYFTEQDGYVQGPLVAVTYIVFYIYCIMAFIMVLIKGRNVEEPIRNILLSFPFIAAVVVVVQLAYPTVILSGSAATCSLLIVYLYLQNKQISIDHLLGIPNRQEFLETLQVHIKKNTQKPLFIAVFSMRNFKQINDKFGQHTGDQFLKAISNYFQEAAKPNRLYRISGDEIAVIIESDNEKQIEDKVNELYQRTKEPWQAGEYSCIIPAVAGMIQYPGTAHTMEDIVNGLEYAVSYAKQESEDHACYCTSKMLNAVRRRQQIAGILKDALQQDGMEVYFQPIWSVEEKRFTMAEALLRLPNTPIGPIYPDEFIPIAEDTRLIQEMTYMVLHKACIFVKKLLEKGVKIESVTVNLSGVQITQVGLADKIFQIIDEHQIPYSTIKLEVTESVLVENPDAMAAFLQDVRQKGIQVGLDDFGTGYCNLVSVMSMPLDVIKIDKSILWASMTNTSAAVMMQNVMHGIKDLGMKIVTEGVENEAQRDFVDACGSDWIQGFLYAKPVAQEEAERILTGERSMY